MLLSCRFLIDVGSVNSYELANSVEFFAGDTQTVYIQLIDASIDRVDQGFMPAGRRYCPASGAVLTCTLNNIDDAKKIVRTASQPFPLLDASIWSFPILASDPIAGTVTLTMQLVQGPTVLNSKVIPGILIRAR